MRTIKHFSTINGVKVGMLFTPRLFEFKTASMDFTDAGSATKVAGMYADIAYCAALNYWTLSDHAVESFQLTRLDFHEWSVTDPAEFGKVMRVAVEAITNKTIEEIIHESEGKKDGLDAGEVKKKTSLSFIQRLKHFLSAIVG